MAKKTRDERLGELSQSLNFIRNMIRQFHASGDDSCLYLGVAPQLRALVCMNPNNPKSQMRPLLLDLADELQTNLTLQSGPAKPKVPETGLLASIIALKTWAVIPKPRFQTYSLRNWMLARAYHANPANEYHSRNDIVRNLTDKGAVHYDTDVALLVDSFRRTFSSGYDGLQFFMLDTSAAVVYLGSRLLRIVELKSSGSGDPEREQPVADLDRNFEQLKINMLHRGTGNF